MMPEEVLGREMYACNDCRLFDPETYIGPACTYYTIKDGNSMNISGMIIPLSSSFIPCVKHLEILLES